MNRLLPTQIGRLVLVVGLTGLARAAAADPTPTLRIVLYSHEDGSIPPNVVSRAKAEMTRIYRHAGIKVLWTGTAPTTISPDARPSPTSSGLELTLIILSREMTDQLTVATAALGGAAGTREHRGRITYVFYDRVEHIARTYLNTLPRRGAYDIDNVIVLAHAMAHEIGHLLLPYGHSPTGLMRAGWDEQDLRLAVRGRLIFTAEQAALIRTRLLIQLVSESANTIQEGPLVERPRAIQV